MDSRREMGNEGETLAATFLTQKGYQILERQWRKSDLGEIDLICLDGEELVFVEVKTRQSLESGYPEDSVTPAKLRHLAVVAECFIQERALESKPHRFDVVAIILKPYGPPEMTHLQGV